MYYNALCLLNLYKQRHNVKKAKRNETVYETLPLNRRGQCARDNTKYFASLVGVFTLAQKFMKLFSKVQACTYWDDKGGGGAMVFTHISYMILEIHVCVLCLSPRVRRHDATGDSVVFLGEREKVNCCHVD